MRAMVDGRGGKYRAQPGGDVGERRRDHHGRLVFMVAHGSDGLDCHRGDSCTLPAFAESCYSRRRVGSGDTWTDVAHLFLGSHALRGLLASAAAFVPELQPLVAKAVGSPLTLPLDDDEGDAA
jgi:hypothetical protein